MPPHPFGWLSVFRGTTFRRQLMVFSAAGIIGLSLVSALATSWLGSRQLWQNLQTEGERITSNLANQSRLALAFGSTDNVSEAVLAALSFPDILHIEIHHADGRLLLAKGQGRHDPERDLPVSNIKRPYLEYEDEYIWRFVAPVLAPRSNSPLDLSETEDVALGYVRVDQSKGTLTRLVREVFMVNFTTGLLFAALFLAALRLLSKRLTRPLLDLSETMARAEAGETGLRAKLNGPRDLSEMAHAFNSMMAALEDREKELRATRDNALRFAKLKADFSATVSHEIRTPLNGIIGTLDMLKGSGLKKEQGELLELAWDSSQYLLELINNILDFSRLEAGGVVTETIDFSLPELISNALQVVAIAAEKKHITLGAELSADIPPYLVGDPARIRQILTNLIGNAIKFTPQGNITVEATAANPGKLRLAVHDTGIGIAASDQSVIFDSFTQADPSTTRRYGGSGLGLAICKQLVQLLGGEIGLISSPGQGSTFWFSIPLVEGKKPSHPPKADSPLRFPDSNILVVEDNRTNQVVAAGMLRLLGCQSTIAANGQEALAAYKNGGWDLILMDINMPEMDGIEATAHIRQQEEGGTKRIPIIAMTANTQQEDIDRCLAAGMDDHLAKPLTIESLAVRLQRWLEWTQAPVAPLQENPPLMLDAAVFERLRDALGDSLSEAIRPFLEDVPNYLSEMEQAISAHNAAVVQLLAHAIKGASSNLGAASVADIAKELELQAKSGSLSEATELLNQLRRAFSQVAPALASQIPHTPANDLPAVQGDAPLVLVVDDDRSTRSALRHALRLGGYRVAEAADGQQALDWLTGNQPDVILMDAVMPNLDGFQTCSLLKQDSRWSDLPVLMITALEDRNSIEQAFEVGASDFIPKPIHLSVVNQRVGRIIEATRAERHVRHLAYCDSLTGLPNRLQFIDQLTDAISRASPEEQLAVLFLDLDRFKYINDTLGHEVGDKLLVAMSKRLRQCLRAEDLVARLGGDEFTVLLKDLPTPTVAANIAHNICRAIATPLEIDGHEVFVSTSIGISVFPLDGQNVSSLLRHADTAMYRAKQSGNSFCYYETSMELVISDRLKIESALRRALERNEITVYYQPVVSAHNGMTIGVEALARWMHPEKGIIPPNDFISIAEETGLILPLGEQVLRQACSQAKSWLDAGVSNFRVAVNLSGKQLEHPDLENTILTILRETTLPAAALVLEITESVLMEQAQDPVGILHRLRNIGVNLSIDDFGTGYSSFSYLKALPANTLKIDRSFVQDIADNADSRAIVTGIIALAHNLRMKVVAEGVETASQRDVLVEAGCDFLQGYFYSKPKPVELIETQLLARSSRWEMRY